MLNMKFIPIIALLFLLPLTVYTQKAETEYAINNYHRYYSDGQKVKDPVKEKSI